MIHLNSNRIDRRRQQTRLGFATTELVIAASLLITGIALIGPMLRSANQLSNDSKVQAMVIDELSSQIERLSQLDDEQRRTAIKSLTLPDHLAARLSSAEMKASEIADDDGRRLIVSIQWSRIGDPPPIVLVGWISPPLSVDSEESTEDSTDE